MPLGELLRLAFGAIRATRLRSLLTTLGIVIGVGAVITMVALGAGAQASVEAQMESLGTDLLTVSSGQQWNRGIASGDRVALTSADAEALRLDAPTLRAVMPRLGGNQQIKFRNRNANVEISGTTADFPAANRMTPAHGRFFTSGEDQSRRRLAVLGSQVPEELEVDPLELLGAQILIRAIPFEVIGIMEPQGDQPGMGDPDETVYVPFRTAEFRIFGTDRLRDITVQVAHPDSIEVALLEVEGVLRREHRLRPDQPNDFRIRDPNGGPRFGSVPIRHNNLGVHC